MFKTIKNYFRKLKGSSGYARWLMHYTKPFLPRILLLMGLQALTSGISVYTAVIGKDIIDSATIGGPIALKLALYIGVIVVIQIIGIITSLIAVMFNERFSFGIRKQVYDKILNSSYSKVQAYHTGDLMTRFTSDCGNIASGISSTLPSIISLLVEFIITFAVLFYYEPFLALSAVIIAPVGGLLSFWLGRKMKRLTTKVQETESEYRSYIQESLSNILILKTFRAEEYASEELERLKNERFHWVLKKSRMSLFASSIMSFAFQGGYILAFAWGSKKLALAATDPTSTFTYGTMSVFLTLVNRIQSPILGLANTIPSVVSVLASAGRVMELQELPLEKKLDEPITNENIGVEIKDLSFGYTDELILKNTDINIKPNEFVAIVGESGIGKTTLIRLIMSFLQSGSGTIDFYNALGEHQTSNANSREFLSYVPQGNTLFSGTIRKNVLMGKQGATEEEIIEALKAASAYQFVCDLPDGLDTVIGERGYGISEGQAQRISIARALIKKAPFLILDEATSSLDEKTELAVLQGIRNLSPRPTCLLITHRRSVLSYCDREIKLERPE